MIKKTITYTDFDGNERTEDFYFNLTKAELMEMQFSEVGGFNQFLRKIISTKDSTKLVELFKSLLLKSYGEKSLDGRSFRKSKEISDAFASTQAYSDLFIELSMSSEKAAEFVTGLIPAEMQEEVRKAMDSSDLLELSK